MRVALTVEQCWHAVPGGTATSILGLARALLDAGDDVELVGVAARHAGEPPAPFRPPIPVRHLPLPRLALYEAWHGPGRLRWPPVERATGPVDVVHATAVAVPPSPRAPLVVTIHDLAFLAEPAAFTRHGLRFFRRGTELARRQAALVLVPSEATAAECRAAGFDADRIRLVPWGHSPERVTADDVAAARARHGLPERYGLFVGTLEPRKNLRRLVQAWGRAAGDVPLVVAGPPGWGDQDLDPGPATLLPIGFLEPRERDVLYAGAAVVAYPSLREGFGLPVLEAMAQGTPVVTSRGTATAEVAGDAGVLVDPLDVDSIAGGIAGVLADPGDLGERGRARAATYTWEAAAARTAAAYREVLGR